MWIIDMPENFHELESNDLKLNFLYKEGNIYIMDNHLAAGWCWLNELDTKKYYNFFHLDQHSDMSYINSDTLLSSIKDKPQLTIEEYMNLEIKRKEGYPNTKLFQWNTYIKAINYLFPNWFKNCYFATHIDKRDDYPEETKRLNITYWPDPFELYTNISYWLSDSKERWIFNFDLDYFFDANGMQLFTDDYIKATAQNLKKGLKHIDVVTIALSPECCGSWDNAIRVMNMVAKELELKFRL